MPMRVTKHDLAYWQAKHMPRWAPASPQWESLPHLLHLAINSHDDAWRSATRGDLDKHNALVTLRAARARGKSLLAVLCEGVQHCLELQPQRAYTYRRWLAQMLKPHPLVKSLYQDDFWNPAS